MQKISLGSSDLHVTPVCLGSMTWGVQNTQQDANQQLDYALAQGINFVDTAEMYAIPPSADTYGVTETIIGNWLSANPAKRNELVLASKVAGPGLKYVRGGAGLSGDGIVQAVDASLQRLQTDYIDLYQLHWPNRPTPQFGKHWPSDRNFTGTDKDAQTELMLDCLRALDSCIKAGKIRHAGLSNETPWGISEYLRLAREHGLPKMVSVQNEFNLAHTKDWPYLIEQCVMEEVAYLPWSPLAAGVLSGKYIDGARPAGSRWTMMQRNGLFRDTPAVNTAVSAYQALAKKHGITAAQLALAWCHQVDGVTSTIIGATSFAQLQENIAAFEMNLSPELLEEINQLLKQHPAPF